MCIFFHHNMIIILFFILIEKISKNKGKNNSSSVQLKPKVFKRNDIFRSAFIIFEYDLFD